MTQKINHIFSYPIFTLIPNFRRICVTFTFCLGLTLTALLSPITANAIELDQAKSAGSVGEMPTGYLGIVGNSTAEIQELVTRINSERHKRYEQIALENGTPISTVEALAGKKAIEKIPSGQFYKEVNGNWKRK